ncbi:hypothetical protein Nizo2264_0346 [Lactiplantibacillus plantarum]|nr:hypothetical protein ADS73_03055 [Lactiplantibacillus plantarum]KZU16216.1 hypothetical protein Nizo2264_0346 [Lactiplantibacillus plantarum]
MLAKTQINFSGPRYIVSTDLSVCLNDTVMPRLLTASEIIFSEHANHSLETLLFYHSLTVEPRD